MPRIVFMLVAFVSPPVLIEKARSSGLLLSTRECTQVSPFPLRPPEMNQSDGRTDIDSALKISGTSADAMCTNSSAAVRFSLECQSVKPAISCCAEAAGQLVLWIVVP